MRGNKKASQGLPRPTLYRRNNHRVPMVTYMKNACGVFVNSSLLGLAVVTCMPRDLYSNKLETVSEVLFNGLTKLEFL